MVILFVSSRVSDVRFATSWDMIADLPKAAVA
jgi:hypothetical protein